jgi:hypothetical protein
MMLTRDDGQENQKSGGNPPSEALIALDNALACTHLHEQVQVALEDLSLLPYAQQDLQQLETVRKRILQRKAALDGLAEEAHSHETKTPLSRSGHKKAL